MKKGTFIVIDGTDGSGKATQTELLVQRLKKEKRKVKKIDFPQYTNNFFGKFLRECLDGVHGDFLAVNPRIASTIYAADRFESSSQIKKWIGAGYTVIADRYVSANQIHQGGKIKDAKVRKEFLTWLDQMEFNVFKIPRPNVIVYLHVPVELSLDLIKKRSLEKGTLPDQAESDAKHLVESQQSALKIIEKNNKWLKIDCALNGGMRSRDDIHEEIAKKVKRILK